MPIKPLPWYNVVGAKQTMAAKYDIDIIKV